MSERRKDIKDRKDRNQPLVYIPNGAKINVENTNGEEVITRYEKRRVVFDINGVKRFVGGKYGKKE